MGGVTCDKHPVNPIGRRLPAMNPEVRQPIRIVQAHLSMASLINQSTHVRERGFMFVGGHLVDVGKNSIASVAHRKEKHRTSVGEKSRNLIVGEVPVNQNICQ